MCLSGSCRYGYTDADPESDYCYRVWTTTPMNFDKAWQYCKDHRAHLILVKNSEENHRVAEFLSKSDLGPAPQVWLSYRYLSDRNHQTPGLDSIFTGIPGTSASGSWKGAYPPGWEAYTYRNFGGEGPDQEHHCATTNLVQTSSTFGTWSKVGCGTTELPFGCMRKKMDR